MVGAGSSVYDASQQVMIIFPEWGHLASVTSIAMSLAVNALVTGLIVFKMFKVYWEVKPLYSHTFGPPGGSKLRGIIFIILESGMALFTIQLAYLVVSILPTQAALVADQPILSIQRVLNVIISSGIFTYNFTDNMGLARA